MVNLFNKGRLATLLALVCLSAMSSSLSAAYDCCEQPSCNRLYVGAFGGGIFSDSSEASQFGTAFFSEVDSIGPLSIIAEGNLNKTSTGFGGVQVGYEWYTPSYSDWSIATAAELEAFFFKLIKRDTSLTKQ